MPSPHAPNQLAPASPHSGALGWLAMAITLAAASGFRWLRGDWSSDDLGWDAHLLFVGVAMAAAFAAALVTRWWSTPGGAFVIGAGAGVLATLFDKSPLGASAGLLIGVGLTARYGVALSRGAVVHGARWGGRLAAGVLLGALAGAVASDGGLVDLARATGVLGGGWLIAQAFRSAEPCSRPTLWRSRLGWLAGVVAGAYWFSEPVARWLIDS